MKWKRKEQKERKRPTAGIVHKSIPTRQQRFSQDHWISVKEMSNLDRRSEDNDKVILDKLQTQYILEQYRKERLLVKSRFLAHLSSSYNKWERNIFLSKKLK